MPIHQPAKAHRLGQHEQAADSLGAPTEPVENDPGRESHLLVVLAADQLGRRDVGLDLDDHDRTVCRTQPEHVDRAAFAVLRVRHLEDGLPAERLQAVGNQLGERRVVLVEQPLELGATPSRSEVEARFERSEDRSQTAERQVLEPAMLDARDR